MACGDSRDPRVSRLDGTKLPLRKHHPTGWWLELPAEGPCQWATEGRLAGAGAQVASGLHGGLVGRLMVLWRCAATWNKTALGLEVALVTWVVQGPHFDRDRLLSSPDFALGAFKSTVVPVPAPVAT